VPATFPAPEEVRHVMLRMDAVGAGDNFFLINDSSFTQFNDTNIITAKNKKWVTE